MISGAQDIAGAAMRQDITLLRSGCTQCWSAMFLKSMGMLGLCDSLDNLRYQDEATLRNLRLDVDRVEQAYMDKYEGLYWDTHCTEPRGRGVYNQLLSNITAGSTQTQAPPSGSKLLTGKCRR